MNNKKKKIKHIPDIKEKKKKKDELLNDFLEIYKKHKNEDIPGFVTRDYYRYNSEKFNDSDWAEIFGTFGNFKREAKELIDEFKKENINENFYKERSEITITKNHANKSYPRKYFVTSAVEGAPLNQKFFASITTYCKVNKAELVILPMRGVRVTDEGYPEELIDYADHFATEFKFNSNLIAKDFILNPQQINPLTGLQRFGQKQYSLIIASPKQFMKPAPVSSESLTHIVHSTGTVSKPKYANNRIGRLANQDHCLGGLIVEIRNDRVFHLRQAVADSTGGFYDLGKYYTHNKVEQRKASAIVLGDYHSGSERKDVIENWMECVELVNPKFIIFHDLFDGHSINPWHKHDMEQQVNRKEHIDTLEKELNYVGDVLTKWSNKFPDKELVIVYSNHDDFLKRYLGGGEYVNDRLNHRISLTLASWLLDGKNPIEEYIKENFKIPHILWLPEDKDCKLHGVDIGNHGHKTINGMRQSSATMVERAFSNSITGHLHTPEILRNSMIVGTSTEMDLKYNRGGASSWLHASGLLYKNAKKQLIISVEGFWKL